MRASIVVIAAIFRVHGSFIFSFFIFLHFLRYMQSYYFVFAQ